MDSQALAAELAAMQVRVVDPADAHHPGDPDRAALYLPELRAMRDFFNPPPNVGARAPVIAGGLGGLGANYPYFQPALTNPNLLNELAKLLDFFISPALDLEMTRLNQPPLPVVPIPTTAAYYANHIFDPVDATYVNNRNVFLGQYPVTQAAVAQLTLNFRQNIILACARIFNDRALIQNMFSADYPHLTLTSLQQINSTGSDFHKGGKQVLILHFSARYWPGMVPWWTTFRLVYKPSDIEVDCLIAGNSQAINQVIPGFMAANGSLVELLNARLATLVPAGEPLPTYKILPRTYMSSQIAGGPPFTAPPLVAGLHDLYGYIEFLTFEESGFGTYDDWDQGVPTWWNAYYPFGASDFTIFASQTPQQYEALITRFYRQMGEFVALACTFSIFDMHLQNVRVHGFQPFLIDLEISLSDPVNAVSETLLLNPATGGIDGYALGNTKFKWVRAHQPPAHDTIDPEYIREKFQNRLYRLIPARRLVAPEPVALLQGIADGLTSIANAPVNYFNAWWLRVANVLVRDLPYTTSELQDLQRTIFIRGPQLINAFAAAIQQTVNSQFAADYASYVAGSPPKYLAMDLAVAGPDYTSLDLPIYYRRVDQTEITDSRGVAVPIPNNVMINGVAQPSNVGRNTYYAAALLPTLQNNLAAISGAGNAVALAARIATLQGNVTAALNNGLIPNAPQFNFLPI